MMASTKLLDAASANGFGPAVAWNPKGNNATELRVWPDRNLAFGATSVKIYIRDKDDTDAQAAYTGVEFTAATDEGKMISVRPDDVVIALVAGISSTVTVLIQ